MEFRVCRRRRNMEFRIHFAGGSRREYGAVSGAVSGAGTPVALTRVWRSRCSRGGEAWWRSTQCRSRLCWSSRGQWAARTLRSWRPEKRRQKGDIALPRLRICDGTPRWNKRI